LKDGIDSRYFVEAVAKALEVLESFDSDEEELTISEVGRRVGVPYSSAFRLVYTLEKRGYVMRRGGSKKYVRTPHHKRYRIGYAALGDRALRLSQEISRGMVLAARNAGIELIVRDNELSPQKTLANLDILLKEGVALLIEYQLNETVAHLIAAKCHEAGTPVIAISFPQPGAYYFGGNSDLAGRLAGEFLCEFARTKWRGEVDSVLVLPAGESSTQEVRHAAIRDSLTEGLKSRPKLHVVVAPQGLTPQHGYREAGKFFRENSSRSSRFLIAALYDGLAVGAASAAERMGLAERVVIAGQGGASDVRRHLKRNGPLKASVAYFPEGYGERVIALALRVLAGETVPAASYTDHVVLTNANVEQYYPAMR
jgi:ribose transport system substrate-binding protein